MYGLRLLAVVTVIFVGSAIAGSAQQPAAPAPPPTMPYGSPISLDIVDGKIIGAIGASGGTAPQDGQVAKAGADAAK